ncbi:MAG: N-acetyltransferase family protein [Haloarculaceae archaeon]
MTSDVIVRPAHQADVSDIQHVASEAWHAAYDGILGPDVVEEFLDEWYEDDAVEAGVEHEAQDFVVAVRDDQVIGYAHVGPHPPKRTYRLYRIYVHPDDWGEGIGRQLLAEIEQELYDRDVTVYEAEVLADNEVGVSFYESTGFERVDERETEMKGVSADEYLYRKRL